LLDNGADREALDAAGQTLGLWLASAAAYDLAGALWTANAPVASVDVAAVRALLQTRPDLPVLLDGVYADWDEEYLDAEAVSRR
jgi:hypothetical protein